jgi:hypothetical protein
MNKEKMYEMAREIKHEEERLRTMDMCLPFDEDILRGR